VVDDTFSRSAIPIRRKPRLRLTRRLAFLLENMLSYPTEWQARNAAALKQDLSRPHLAIAGAMHSRKSGIVDDVCRRLLAPGTPLPHDREMDPQKLRWYVELIYKLLMSSVQTRDRMPLLSYSRYLAAVRKKEGFSFEEVREAVLLFVESVLDDVRRTSELQGMDQALVDSLRLTVQLAVDEMESVCEADEDVVPEGDHHVLRDPEWEFTRKKHFLQTVIDSIDDPVLIIDDTYRVRLMNRFAHEHHLGTEPATDKVFCYQLSHGRAVPCEGREHACPLRQVFATGKPVRVTHTHIDRWGKAYDVALLASPLRDDAGHLIGVIETSYRMSYPR
jgi:hypothetical protein